MQEFDIIYITKLYIIIWVLYRSFVFGIISCSRTKGTKKSIQIVSRDAHFIHLSATSNRPSPTRPANTHFCCCCCWYFIPVFFSVVSFSLSDCARWRARQWERYAPSRKVPTGAEAWMERLKMPQLLYASACQLDVNEKPGVHNENGTTSVRGARTRACTRSICITLLALIPIYSEYVCTALHRM